MIDVKNLQIKFNFSDKETEKAEDIRRCLKMLYSIRIGEQPLDRDLGIDFSFQDKPLKVAKNMFAIEVIKKTEKYEPRVKVDNVTFDFDPDNGQMIPSIHLQKGDEWE